MMKRSVLLIGLTGFVGTAVGAEKIDYRPISAETRQLGRLAKYSAATKTRVEEFGTCQD